MALSHHSPCPGTFGCILVVCPHWIRGMIGRATQVKWSKAFGSILIHSRSSRTAVVAELQEVESDGLRSMQIV